MALVIILFGLAATTNYYVRTWHRIGRDPERETIIPRFNPPDLLSPVAAGYLWNRGIDGRFTAEQAFSVGLVSLATKRAIRLEELHPGYRLTRLERPETPLSNAEKVLLRHLFEGGVRVVLLNGSHDPRIDLALGHFVSAVRSDHHGVFWRDNLKPWLLGVALLVTSFILAGAVDDNTAKIFPVFMLVAFMGLGLFATMFRFGMPVHSLLSDLMRGKLKKLVYLLVAVPVIVLIMSSPVRAMASMVADVPPAVLALSLAGIAEVALFFWLLKAPTVSGSRTLEHITGYRLYLSVAEAPALQDGADAPEMTPQQFERHLPYAMALGVADAWENRFEVTSPDGAGIDYPAAWYHGALTSRGMDPFSTNLERSLTQCISQAAHGGDETRRRPTRESNSPHAASRDDNHGR